MGTLKRKFIIGIDEVGRGACAGPLYVCAFALPVGFGLKGRGLPPLRDSKKLSFDQRNRWLAFFLEERKKGNVDWAISRILHSEMDRIGISESAKRAATRSASELIRKKGKPVSVLLDGSLYIKESRREFARVHVDTLIKGDERIPAISCASIVAKVRRDAFMRRFGKKYPKYGFEIHKGYGTHAHRAVVRRHGPSEVHRLTFIRGWDNINKK